MLVATVGWGLFTGHGLGGSAASSSVAPFNVTWIQLVGITLLGAGILLAIPVAWITARGTAVGDIYLAAIALLVAGAIARALD